jgi:hypothetical protein
VGAIGEAMRAAILGKLAHEAYWAAVRAYDRKRASELFKWADYYAREARGLTPRCSACGTMVHPGTPCEVHYA